jgi:anti-anti-sigma factor
MAAPVTQDFGDRHDVEPRPISFKNPPMAVETVYFDSLRANVKVVGELDLGTAAPLWAVLQGHVTSGRRFLRLDLSQVSFIDATVLSGIVGVHQELLARRGTLVLVGVRVGVARVLRLTGMDEVLFVGGSRGDDDLVHPTATLELSSG